MEETHYITRMLKKRVVFFRKGFSISTLHK